MKRGGLLRRSPIAVRRKPLRAVSSKKRQENEEWQRISARVRSERPGCEGQKAIGEALYRWHLDDFEVDALVIALRNCTGRSTEVHHIKQRSLGGTNEDSNCLALDAACHRFAHENIKLATKLGMLRPSWSES